jgi:predicted enzyme related to lactoylglutathione lyase
MLSASRGALVALQARDFERAVAFYKEVLGLPMTFRHESYWAEFQAPGLSIGIEAAGDDAVVGGGTISLCFEVRAIDSVVDGLRSRGISFLGPVRDTFHGKEAYFTDSEGNPIVLHESAGAAAGALAGAPASKTARGTSPRSKPRAAKEAKARKSAKPASAKDAGAARTTAKKSAPPKRTSPRGKSSRGRSSRRGRR